MIEHDKNRPNESSGLAIASLVLGILGFFTLGLTSIPAAISGHLSLSKIKKSAGAIAGRGMAVAGLVLGYVSLVFAICVLAVVLSRARAVNDRMDTARSLSNVREISKACRIYASDNEGKFPPNLSVLLPNYLPDRAMLVSPFAKDKSEISYEYTAGLKEDDAPNQIVVRDKHLSKQGYRAVVYVSGESKAER